MGACPRTPTGPSSTGPRRRARRPRRRLPALVVIIVAGVVAVAAAFALASALDDDRPHGPYLIGAWTFGDSASLATAVKAGALDEVSVDWLQSRADGSVVAPRLDTAFIAEARRKDCRVFATLTDYDEATHTFDRSIPAAILATAASRRRHAAAVAAWCQDLRPGRRGRGLGGAQGLATATRSRRSSRSSRGGSTTTAASSPSTSSPSSGSPAAGTRRRRRTGRVSAGRSTSSG